MAVDARALADNPPAVLDLDGIDSAASLIDAATMWLGSTSILWAANELALSFSSLFDSTTSHSLTDVLTASGVNPGIALNARSLPDAMWLAIANGTPALTCYPIGPLVERALKKAVAALVARHRDDSSDTTESRAQGALIDEYASMDATESQSYVVTHLLFEVAIAQLRRYYKAVKDDTGYWYQFTENGRLVSVEGQLGVRRELFLQCERLAGDYLGLDASPPHLGPEHNVGVERFPQPGNSWIGSTSEPPTHLRLGLYGKTANVGYHLGSIEAAVNRIAADSMTDGVLTPRRRRRFHSLTRDLLDFGVLLYMADRFSARDASLSRKLRVLMPVRHVEVWKRDLVQPLVGFLGREIIDVDLVQRKEPCDALGFEVGSDDRCVVLFSGGLDSLAGVVSLLEAGRQPVTVSHYSASALASLQSKLLQRLDAIYGGVIERHVPCFVGKSHARNVPSRLGDPKTNLMGQPLRSILFLSLAVAVAIELGIDTVYMFENGPIAINPLASEACVNTRTAHPHVLDRFQRLVSEQFGVDIRIENPFLYSTKTEVVRHLSGPAVRDLIADTTSCWCWLAVPSMAHSRGLKLKGPCHHDGECMPCIIRRVALHHAELSAYDDRYLTDAFTQFDRLSRMKATSLADNFRMAQLVQQVSDNELMHQVPELSVCVEGVDLERLTAMYRRHSQELTSCFAELASGTAAGVFDSASEVLRPS